MNELLEKEAAKKVFGQIWDDVIGYLKLYDFLKLKVKTITGTSKAVSSINSFWYSMLKDRFAGEKGAAFWRLQNGDMLKFKKVFLTEWAPKLPGRIWTTEGIDALHHGQRQIDPNAKFNNKVSSYDVLNPNGKAMVISAGFGSVRISHGRNDIDHYMYMSLVDEDNWRCDYGIPVVVSQSVYREYQKHCTTGAPYLKTIEGILHVHDELPFSELIPRAIGATLSSEAANSLRYRPNLPKCYLYIASPLSLKFTQNNSHPWATAWTMFQTTLKHEPYRYTYTTFNPQSPESIDDAIKFIHWYVANYKGKKIITDFDGMVPRLDATIPISSNPLKSRKAKVKELLTGCDDWVTSTMSRLGRW
ncbi:MAG: hypothetical protein ABSD50_08055 [Smithella sp.]|jgi:hypothetical protein